MKKQVCLDPMNFDDPTPVEVPVTIGKVSYILKEPSEAAVVQWRDYHASSVRMDKKGNPIGVSGVGGADALLLSLCLFEVTDKGHIPLSRQKILGWKSEIVQALSKRAKEMAGLDEEDDRTVEELQDEVERLNELIETKSQKNGTAHSEMEDWAKNVPALSTDTSDSPTN